MQSKLTGKTFEERSEYATTVHISSKSHLNITFNLYQCGLRHISPALTLSIKAGSVFTGVYIIKGQGQMEFGMKCLCLNRQQGFYAFPDSDLIMRNTGSADMEIIWLAFSGYLVENYLNRAGISRNAPVFTDRDEFIGTQMKQIFAASRRFPNRYCRMMSMQYSIFSHLLDLNPDDSGNIYSDDQNHFAVEAANYIENHFADNISVHTISAALGITSRQLYTVFRKEIGVSPRKYLILYRIEKACQRLKTCDLPISGIAESVGYANQFYFAREFKKLTGMTPSGYRKSPHKLEVFTSKTFVPTLQNQYGNDMPRMTLE